MAAAVLTRRLRRWLLVAGFFTTLSIINAFPVAQAPHATIGQHGDAFFSVWRLAWVAHQVRVAPSRLFDGNIFYPEGNTLAYSDAMLLPALAVAPAAWAGISPLLVYNLTLLASFVLSGMTAYALVRRLTGSEPAGLLGGIVFAFSPHRLEHFDHLELQFAFWIPLAAMAWHRAMDHDDAPAHLRVAAFASAQVLSSIYHGVFLVTWLGFMTCVWLARRPRRAVKALALQLVPVALVLGVYSLPYLESRERVGERSKSEVEVYSATAADFVSAPSNNVLYGWTSRWGANERHLFPGLVVMALAITGLVTARSAHLRVHLAGLALAVVLALGLNGGLYSLLYDWVLPYRGLRVPARAGILILLGTAVFAGAGLAWLLGRLRSRRAAMTASGVALGLTAMEFLAVPAAMAVPSGRSNWYRMLETMPDAVIFEYPVTVPWRLYVMHDVKYMWRSTEHWRPLLNGYSGNYPRSYVELLYEMRRFPYTPALRYLRQRGATVIVVHEQRGSRPSYDEILERLHRDRYISLIALDHDAGERIAFFRLHPEPRSAFAGP